MNIGSCEFESHLGHYLIGQSVNIRLIDLFFCLVISSRYTSLDFLPFTSSRNGHVGPTHVHNRPLYDYLIVFNFAHY